VNGTPASFLFLVITRCTRLLTIYGDLSAIRSRTRSNVLFKSRATGQLRRMNVAMEENSSDQSTWSSANSYSRNRLIYRIDLIYKVELFNLYLKINIKNASYDGINTIFTYKILPNNTPSISKPFVSIWLIFFSYLLARPCTLKTCYILRFTILCICS